MENGREFLLEILRAIAFALGVPVLDPILLMLMPRVRKSEGQHSRGS